MTEQQLAQMKSMMLVMISQSAHIFYHRYIE
jgi:hypothetical protein